MHGFCTSRNNISALGHLRRSDTSSIKVDYFHCRTAQICCLSTATMRVANTSLLGLLLFVLCLFSVSADTSISNRFQRGTEHLRGDKIKTVSDIVTSQSILAGPRNYNNLSPDYKPFKGTLDTVLVNAVLHLIFAIFMYQTFL